MLVDFLDHEKFFFFSLRAPVNGLELTPNRGMIFCNWLKRSLVSRMARLIVYLYVRRWKIENCPFSFFIRVFERGTLGLLSESLAHFLSSTAVRERLVHLILAAGFFFDYFSLLLCECVFFLLVTARYYCTHCAAGSLHRFFLIVSLAGVLPFLVRGERWSIIYRPLRISWTGPGMEKWGFFNYFLRLLLNTRTHAQNSKHKHKGWTK